MMFGGGLKGKWSVKMKPVTDVKNASSHLIELNTEEMYMIHDALYYYTSHDVEKTWQTEKADRIAKELKKMIREWECEA